VSNIIWHVLCVWTMVTYITLKLTAADGKERKRERDRARWLQQKDAINKRRREKYHQRKNQHVLVTTNCNAWILTYCHGVMNWHLFFLIDICNVYNFVDDEAASNKENVDPGETYDWHHRNDSYHSNNIVDENMSTQLSCN